MKKRRQDIFFPFLSSLVIFLGFSVLGLAGQDLHTDHGKRERHRAHGKGCFTAPNPTYKSTCGGCHLAYPPMLLPASSWKKILDQSDDHFGEQIPIDPKSKEVISKYLSENGADRSSSKKAAKIMKSLKGRSPLRITEVPYIRQKHREISMEVLSRKTIGSLSNCRACHKMAKQGVFDDEYVAIPINLFYKSKQTEVFLPAEL